MSRPLPPRMLLSIAVAYMALLAICIGARFFVPVVATIAEGENMARTCYLRGSVLQVGKCHGFPGSVVASGLLNLPYLLVLGPIAGLFELLALSEGDFRAAGFGALLLILALAAWVPIVGLFIYLRRAARA